VRAAADLDVEIFPFSRDRNDFVFGDRRLTLKAKEGRDELASQVPFLVGVEGWASAPLAVKEKVVRPRSRVF